VARACVHEQEERGLLPQCVGASSQLHHFVGASEGMRHDE
jgi:hypothetical protein